MVKKITIYEKFFVERSLPENFKESDFYLFKHELKRLIPKSFIKILNKPIIINQTILDFKNFSIHPKETFYVDHSFKKISKDTIKNILNSKKKTNYLSNGIWILDTKSENFGHWIIDAMCRLMLVPKQFYSYPILIPKRFEIDWLIEFLDYLDKDYIILNKDEKYIIEKLILTSQAHPSGNFNPEIIQKLRSELLSKLNEDNKEKEKRVWAYREHISRGVGNFEEIEKILYKHNFVLIKTEQLNLQEKIELFKSTKVLAGTHSSGLVNMIFMNKGSKLFEVRDYKDSHKNALFALASALDLSYFYTERRESLIDGDGSINPSKFEEALIKCLL